jgi:hypothetical protein
MNAPAAHAIARRHVEQAASHPHALYAQPAEAAVQEAERTVRPAAAAGVHVDRAGEGHGQ